MEWIVGILCFAMFNFYLVYQRQNGDIGQLKKDLTNLRYDYDVIKARHQDLKYRYMYDSLLSKIQEYADLKGFIFECNSDNVRFFREGYFAEHLHLNQVESRLAELKTVLEKNCPKKCKKAAKK